MSLFLKMTGLMMSKEYIYFVSYSHEKGHGNIEITQNVEMDNFQLIKGAQQVIKDRGECNNPVVTNFILLKIVDITPNDIKENE